MKTLNLIQGGEPTSQIRMKKTISYSEKHLFKSVNCCRFLFCYSDENQDRLRECSKKQIVIKILCLNVLNDDNREVHKTCKYKYFHPGLFYLSSKQPKHQ